MARRRLLEVAALDGFFSFVSVVGVVLGFARQRGDGSPPRGGLGRRRECVPLLSSVFVSVEWDGARR